MKKLLFILLAVSFALAPVPAMADNSEEIAIGVGSFIGGLIIGSAIERDRRYHRYYYEDEYYEPVPRIVCFYKKVDIYIPEYDSYVQRTRRVCVDEGG